MSKRNNHLDCHRLITVPWPRWTKVFVVASVVVLTMECRRDSDSPTIQSEHSSPLTKSVGGGSAQDPPPALAVLYFSDTVTLPPTLASLAQDIEATTSAVWKVPDVDFPWSPELPATDGGFEIRVSLLYGLFRDGESEWDAENGDLYVAVQVDAKRIRRGTVPEKISVEKRVEVPFSATQPLREAIIQKVRQVQSDARRSLVSAIRIGRGSDADVILALSSGDDSAAVAAAREAGFRKLTESIPIFEKWLSDSSPEKMLLAIQAFGTIGDESALKPLSTLVGHNDPDLVKHVVWAIAEVGGEKAQQYLRDIAVGHAYPTIREQAKSLLAEVR